ncbi:MAG: hypothetical protein JWM69_355, partial [Candidatus Binatus sp.]|nr:hypothetical protein [Candidatus Binatus sp.]
RYVMRARCDRSLWLAEAARGTCALFRQADFRTMPSVLERRGSFASVAVTGFATDEVVARQLVVLRDLRCIETPAAEARERVAGELVGGELLVFSGHVFAGRIEVAVCEMTNLVRENRVEHGRGRVIVLYVHPLLHEAFKKFRIVENASTEMCAGGGRSEPFVHWKIRSPHIVELRDYRLDRILRGMSGLSARDDDLVGVAPRRARPARLGTGRAGAAGMPFDDVPVILSVSGKCADETEDSECERRDGISCKSLVEGCREKSQLNGSARLNGLADRQRRRNSFQKTQKPTPAADAIRYASASADSRKSFAVRSAQQNRSHHAVVSRGVRTAAWRTGGAKVDRVDRVVVGGHAQ